MNQCILMGYLGGDPESAYTDQGNHIVSFSLAFRSTKKDKPNWIKTVCFEKQAELAVKHLHKGARIAVAGKLDQSKWTDDNNQTKTAFRLIANTITFIKTDGRGFNEGEQSESYPESPPF